MGFIKSILAHERHGLEALFRRKVKEKAGVFLTPQEFFSQLDLGAPGLEPLKKTLRQKKYPEAYAQLLDYYRRRQLPLFFFPQVYEEVSGEQGQVQKDAARGKKAKTPPQDSRQEKRYRARRDDSVNLLLGFRQPSRSILDEAEAVLAHTFTVPGREPVTFSPSLDWFCDFAGGSFPYASVPDLQKRLLEKRPQDRLSQVSLAPAWEFNKHHHLVELAKAYWLTGDEKFCSEFIIQVLDWMETNPFNMGINWLDGQSMGQRLISWLFALQMFLCSEYISPAFFERIMSFLLLHGTHLWMYLKTDSQSPAALAASCALYLLTYNFPEFLCFNEWRKTAFEVLSRMAPALFREDGTYHDRSSAGHVQALQLLVLPLLLCTINGEHLPRSMRERIEKAFEFLMFTTEPHGGTQKIGAETLPRAWRLSHRAADDHSGLLSLGALLFERGDFKFVSSSEFEDLVWLLGKSGHETFKRLPSRMPSLTSKSFSHGGYQVVRDGWERNSTYLFFNCLSDRLGEVTPSADDHLNFELILQGEPLLVESALPEELLRTGRVPDAAVPRNIVRVRLLEAKGPSGKATASQPRWTSKDDLEYLSGSVGDGYGHRRELLWLKARHWLVVRDLITGEGQAELEMFFHLFSEHELVLRGDLGCVIRCRKSRVRMHPYFPTHFQCQMLKGQDDSPRARAAGPARERELGYLLRYYSKVKFPLEIVVWWGWDKEDFRNPPLEELKAALDDAAKG